MSVVVRKFRVLVLPWTDGFAEYRRGGVMWDDPVKITAQGQVYIGEAALFETDEGVVADMEIEDSFYGLVSAMYPAVRGSEIRRLGFVVEQFRIDRVDLWEMRPGPWSKTLSDVARKCECGGAALGYVPGKVGHSRWCPVFDPK